MNSLDTNVLARFIVRDDDAQAVIADAILAEPCFVTDTVLLETAWLLSSRYGLRRKDLGDTLHDVLNLPQLNVTNLAGVRWAVDRFLAGADLADMLHLAASQELDSFVSFDRRLAQQAGPDTPVPVDTLR